MSEKFILILGINLKDVKLNATFLYIHMYSGIMRPL